MFFRYNTALGPPYQILLDTNFLNFSISNKLDIITAGMDCLYGKCKFSIQIFTYTLLMLANVTGVPYISDCVMAELEKLGSKYRVALRYVTLQ